MKACKKKSFIKDFVITNLISLMLVFILFLFFIYIVNIRLEISFPVIEDILEYEKYLKNEQYSKIPLKGNSNMIICDENNAIIYSSNDQIAEKLTPNDIEYINDYNSDEYYMQSTIMNENNEIQYYIEKVKMNEEDEEDETIGFALLNEGYEVIRGNLLNRTTEIF